MLDADKGGYFRIAPDRDDYVSKQLYLPDNALLITRFMTPDGVGEVQDFMPVIEGKPTDRHRIVRRLRVARGTMRFVLDIQPRFDYGRAKHTVEVTEHGALFRSGSMELTLNGSGKRDPGDPEAAVPERVGDGLRVTVNMHEGQTGGVVLESMGGQPKAMRPAEVTRLSDDTGRFWRNWLNQSTLSGPVAGDGLPVRDDTQADDLRADRGAGGRRDHGPARGARRGA